MRDMRGSKNPNWKGGIRKTYYCVDCGQPVSRKDTKRCCKCQSFRHSIYLRTEGRLIGEKNPCWRGGKPKCLDCGITLRSYIGKRCVPCNKKHQWGINSSRWEGGITPEREKVASTLEWKNLVSNVWKWHDATCDLCGKKKTKPNQQYHIHHIITFAVKEQRLNPNNLVLLCAKCHRWVHSKKNINQIYILKRDVYEQHNQLVGVSI